jgi:hypothetical protein
MAGGREYSQSQKKIIGRYYDNHDTIILTRLGEIQTEIALAVGQQKKLDQLWKRAGQALEKTSLKPEMVAKLVESRDLEALGRAVMKLSR